MPVDVSNIVAVVGSPSSTNEVTLNLSVDAYHVPVYGRMVAFELTFTNPDGTGHSELALGTVTKVETVNPFHQATSLEARHVAAAGSVGSYTGDSGDVRAVRVGVEAVFRRNDDNDSIWTQAGSTLSNSPATGTPVTLVGQPLVDELMAGREGQRWLGRLRGSDVQVPFTEPDFSGARGSRMSVIAGATGSGKSVTAALQMACDLYHDRMGQIIIDPQGQWSTEIGLTFSLQGLAAALGRQVHVVQLARSLRLRKDAPMFTELLVKAGLFRELTFGASAAAQIESARDELAQALGDRTLVLKGVGSDDWTAADPAHLMVWLLEHLRETLDDGTIYAGEEGRKRVQYRIRRPTADELIQAGEAMDEADADRVLQKMKPGILDHQPGLFGGLGGPRWNKVFPLFATLHNLWSPFTPEGAELVWSGHTAAEGLPAELRRRGAWGLLMSVYEPAANEPAPWLILDVSADGLDVPGTTDAGEEESGVLEVARRILDDHGVKARIMRQLLEDSLAAGAKAFKAGKPLNCRITVEEASLYATQPDANTDDAIRGFSDALVDAVERARKLGIGLRFILQSVAALREAIWKQCTTRTIGVGLTEQADLRRVENVVGAEHTALYRSLASPEATGNYTFLFSGGGVTGLSFGPRPIFLDMLTDPAEWLALNREWITAARAVWRHRLPAGDSGGTLTAIPTQPHQAGRIGARTAIRQARTAAAGQAAAARLAAATGPSAVSPGAWGGFGMAQAAHNPNDDPPPF